MLNRVNQRTFQALAVFIVHDNNLLKNFAIWADLPGSLIVTKAGSEISTNPWDKGEKLFEPGYAGLYKSGLF